MGINLADVYTTLSAFIGGSYVNDFVEFNNIYQVNIAGDGASRGNITDINSLSVRNAQGDMIPFGSFNRTDYGFIVDKPI